MIKIKKKNSKPFFFSLAAFKNFLNKSYFSYTTRQKIIVVSLFILFFLLVIKLVNLQVFQHSNKEQFIQNRAYKESEETQERGAILDRNKNVLAMSIKTYKISLDAKVISDLTAIENLLSKYDIHLSSEHYKAIKLKKRYIPIQSNISTETILKIKNDIKDEIANMKAKKAELNREKKKYRKDAIKKEQFLSELKNIKEDKFICIKIESKDKRIYPEEELASHIIGKINSESVGTYGIEYTCNKQLKGENIKRKKLVINGYKRIFIDSLAQQDIEHPNDVVLTIDKKLQFIVEEELEKGLKRTKAKRGVAIIQNPYNGEILAMACLPTYNPSEPVEKIENLTNIAIGKADEPGSTFKIIILSTVLQEGIFKLTDKIYCENGNFKIFGQTIHDHDKQKTITVQQILEQSSNVGTSKLALKTNNQIFYNYIKSFGFDSPTGIDLPGEVQGTLYPIKSWSKISPCSLSFGQELKVTPIQTIGAYSVIANGGTLFKPKIIKAIGDKEFKDAEIVRRNVVSEGTAYKVRQALKGVVTNGTGKSAKVQGYSVGGKTGTAQKWDLKLKKYSKKNYLVSFCGMLPAMNPQVVILVVYDEPYGDEYYASTVAAPVFSKIAQRVAEYLNIPPDQPEDFEKKGKGKGAKR